jgi:adenylate cyclase
LLLGWSNAAAQVNAWSYDFLLRLRPQPPISSAVLLAIDEDSLDAYGGLLHIREPLARALDVLAPLQPAAVAIDIVLSEPGADAENAALERALSRISNVVLAAHLRTNSAEKASGAWQEPLPRFRGPGITLGHVHAEPDSDGVCRRILLAKAGGGKRLWAMALEAYRLAHGGEPIVETEDGLELGPIFIPAPARE